MGEGEKSPACLQKERGVRDSQDKSHETEEKREDMHGVDRGFKEAMNGKNEKGTSAGKNEMIAVVKRDGSGDGEYDS